MTTEPAIEASAVRASCGLTASRSVSALAVVASGAVPTRTPCAPIFSRAAGLISITEMSRAS